MPMPAPMTVRPNPMPAPMYASAMSIRPSSASESSVMSVDGHADEHGRQEREYIGLHQNDDQLERRQSHADRQRQHHADTDARNRPAEQLRKDEDERQQRQNRDVPAGHVRGK